MKEYADPVIDWLDAGQDILGRRFFREVRATTSPTFDRLRRKRILPDLLGYSPVPSSQMGHTPKISHSLSKIFREYASSTIRRFAIV